MIFRVAVIALAAAWPALAAPPANFDARVEELRRASETPGIAIAIIEDGKTTLATFDIDTLGLGASWTQLLASCPANTTRPAAATSNLNINAAPAIPTTSAAPATPPK